MSQPNSAAPGAFRFSLREFLLLVAAAAVACAALKFANEWWVVAVAAVAMVLTMGLLVVALVDRGPRQAFAMGFVACLALYGGLILAGREVSGGGGATRTSNREMDPYDGRLPTTRLMRPVFVAVSETMYGQFGKFGAGRLRKSELPENAVITEGSPGDFVTWPGQPPAPGGPIYTPQGETPQRGHFFPIAHLLWALLLGYIGGHFARFIFARRLRDESSASATTKTK